MSEHPSGLFTVSVCVMSNFTKSRVLALQVFFRLFFCVFMCPYTSPITRVNQDKLHSVIQFALDRTEQGPLLQYQCMSGPQNSILYSILYHAIPRNWPHGEFFVCHCFAGGVLRCLFRELPKLLMILHHSPITGRERTNIHQHHSVVFCWLFITLYNLGSIFC